MLIEVIGMPWGSMPCGGFQEAKNRPCLGYQPETEGAKPRTPLFKISNNLLILGEELSEVGEIEKPGNLGQTGFPRVLTMITEDDIEMVTLENVLTIHPYNDLGLLARGKLIVLAEAQSTWSLNIIFRLANYYFDSVMSYLVMKNIDLYGSVKLDIPDVEAFVIFTGKKKIDKEILSLNQEFFRGNPNKPEFRAKVIHGSYKGGIIEEYMGFCRIWDENVLKAETPEQKQKAVAMTIELCIRKGYLAEYLQAHRAEVEKIMITMLSPEYVKKAAERTERIKGDISVLRFIKIPEDQIKEASIKRYDLTPTYAQNFLDDDTDPDDCRPWAI